MEFSEVLRRRRMVRNFDGRPVDPAVLDAVVAAAARMPSAGFTQGVDLLVLDGPEQTALYWDATTNRRWRETTRRPGILRVPTVVVPLVDPEAYARRYREPDKASSGLGEVDAWPVPYWWVDAAFAALTVLLAAVDAGLGAGFLGMFRGEESLLAACGVPTGRRAVGAVLLGHPALPEEASPSLVRGWRDLHDVIHRGRW